MVVPIGGIVRYSRYGTFFPIRFCYQIGDGLFGLNSGLQTQTQRRFSPFHAKHFVMHEAAKRFHSFLHAISSSLHPNDTEMGLTAVIRRCFLHKTTSIPMVVYGFPSSYPRVSPTSTLSCSTRSLVLRHAPTRISPLSPSA